MIELPSSAAWRHLDVRDGFEVLFPRRNPSGYQLDGYATAVEGSQAWGIRYALTLDASWTTRSALRPVRARP